MMGLHSIKHIGTWYGRGGVVGMSYVGGEMSGYLASVGKKEGRERHEVVNQGIFHHYRHDKRKNEAVG